MGILSPVFKECTKKTYTIGNFLCTHPFEWNKTSNLPQVCTKWKKSVIYRLNVIFIIFYVSFVAGRCIQVNFSTEESEFSLPFKIYIILFFLWMSFAVIHQWVFYTSKNELILFYKQTFTLADQLSNFLSEEHPNELKVGEGGTPAQNANVGDEETEGGCQMPKILDLWLPFMYNVAFLFCCLLGVFALVFPNSPELISSVILPGSGIVRWMLLVPCALFQFNFFLSYTINSMLYLALMFGFLFSEFIALRQIKRWLLAGHTRGISRQKIQNILKMYRQLEILQEFFHDKFCRMIFPYFIHFTMLYIVLGVFVSIRMTGYLSILLGMFSCGAILLIIVVIESCAELHERSKTILYLMKSYDVQKRLTPYEKKTVESFRLIQIQMRSSYYIDKLHVLTVLEIVMDQTVSFLVAFV